MRILFGIVLVLIILGHLISNKLNSRHGNNIHEPIKTRTFAAEKSSRERANSRRSIEIATADLWTPDNNVERVIPTTDQVVVIQVY